MKPNQIIKALECCAKADLHYCANCPYERQSGAAVIFCYDQLKYDALTLVKELTEENKSIQRRLQHLCQSKFIAAFDEVDPKTKEYKQNIEEADKTVETYCWGSLQYVSSVVRNIVEKEKKMECKNANHSCNSCGEKKCGNKHTTCHNADVVEVRHGYWHDNGERTSYGTLTPSAISCSICGSSAGASWMNYCPNCGAKMEGERKE